MKLHGQLTMGHAVVLTLGYIHAILISMCIGEIWPWAVIGAIAILEVSLFTNLDHF